MVRLPVTAARRTTMSLTFAAAARLAGIDKSTLRRAVKAGKLSAVRDANGVWQIEACEVERLYPLALLGGEASQGVPQSAADGVPRHAPGDAATAAPDRTSDPATDVLVRELRLLLEQARTDATTWRQAWETQVAQQRQLAAPQPKGWWRWLRSTG